MSETIAKATEADELTRHISKAALDGRIEDKIRFTNELERLSREQEEV